MLPRLEEDEGRSDEVRGGLGGQRTGGGGGHGSVSCRLVCAQHRLIISSISNVTADERVSR